MATQSAITYLLLSEVRVLRDIIRMTRLVHKVAIGDIEFSRNE